jgi:hypothetical protein
MVMPTIGWSRSLPSQAVHSGFGPSFVSSTCTMRADSVPLPASWMSITAFGLPVASSMLRQRPTGVACCAQAVIGSRQESVKAAIAIRMAADSGSWKRRRPDAGPSIEMSGAVSRRGPTPRCGR